MIGPLSHVGCEPGEGNVAVDYPATMKELFGGAAEVGRSAILIGAQATFTNPK